MPLRWYRLPSVPGRAFVHFARQAYLGPDQNRIRVLAPNARMHDPAPSLRPLVTTRPYPSVSRPSMAATTTCRPPKAAESKMTSSRREKRSA